MEIYLPCKVEKTIQKLKSRINQVNLPTTFGQFVDQEHEVKKINGRALNKQYQSLRVEDIETDASMQ